MKLLKAFVLAILVVNFTLVPAGAFTMAHRYERCRFESLNGHPGYTDFEVRSLLACAVTKYDVPGGFGTLLWIAERESHLNPRALNTSSGTCGLFQMMPRYWPGRVAITQRERPFFRLSSSCLDARANALTSARMMAEGGLGPWR